MAKKEPKRRLKVVKGLAPDPLSTAGMEAAEDSLARLVEPIAEVEVGTRTQDGFGTENRGNRHSSAPFLVDYVPREARERMARQRYQDPPLELRGERSRSYWAIRVRVPRMTTQGRMIGQVVLNCGFCDEVTKRQAERKRAELLAKVNNIALTAPADILLADFVVEVYRKKHFPTLTNGSCEKYDAHIKNHILPALGEMRLKEIGAGELQDFFNAKSDLAWNTRMDIRNIISSIFTKAHDWSWWDGRNPVEGLDLGRKRRAREQRYVGDDDLKLLLAHLPDCAAYPRFDMSLIVRTVAFCGLRPSEAYGLKRKYIHLDTGQIEIRLRYRRGDEDVPKSESGNRELPLGDFLDEYRVKCHNLGPEDYVFTGLDGKPYDDRAVQHYVIRPAATAAGIYYPGFGLHRLRSRSITRLQQMGASGIEAKIHAGHSRIDMTKEYTQLPRERHEELVRRMQSEFLRGGEGQVQ